MGAADGSGGGSWIYGAAGAAYDEAGGGAGSGVQQDYEDTYFWGTQNSYSSNVSPPNDGGAYGVGMADAFAAQAAKKGMTAQSSPWAPPRHRARASPERWRLPKLPTAGG